MKIREIDLEKDYDMLCKWWADHGMHLVHKAILPPTGFLIEESVAGWVYFLKGVPLAVMAWTVSKKDIEKEFKKDCIKYLIKACEEVVKMAGYKVLFVYTEKKGLGDKLEEAGFSKWDTDITQFIKLL
jgi:hypothetical protein